MIGTIVDGLGVAVGVRPNLAERHSESQIPLEALIALLRPLIDIAKTKIISASNVFEAASRINEGMQSGLADHKRIVVSDKLPVNSKQYLYEGEYRKYIEPLMGGLQAVIFVVAWPRTTASWLPRTAMGSDEHHTLDEGEARVVQRENETLAETIIKRGAR